MIKICIWTCDMTSKVTLARWTQLSGPLCLWQCLHNWGFWQIWSVTHHPYPRSKANRLPALNATISSTSKITRHNDIIGKLVQRWKSTNWHNWSIADWETSINQNCQPCVRRSLTHGIFLGQSTIHHEHVFCDSCSGQVRNWIQDHCSLNSYLQVKLILGWKCF